MHKTLLLCFIHGFKGDGNTFGTFREHLRALISHALPNISVTVVTYPQFETRGNLKECVVRFREWLQNVVIDIEVASNTPSPTIDPSVHTILIGHSMGGIVAADTLLAITSELPLPSSTAKTADINDPSSRPPSPPYIFMFPYIQGILAFDTPYLGISPGVLAHGAETHYQTASTAYGALSSAASIFGFSATSSVASTEPARPQIQKAVKVGPASAKEALAASEDAAATPAWQRWGKYAMFAGAAGAVAAGGAAAYLKRDTITEGWGWVGSHLEFVGCLLRGEELKARMGSLVSLHEEQGIGFANLITVLGKGARRADKNPAGGSAVVEVANGAERTFCNLPQKDGWRGYFERSVNEKVTDEVAAHMSMFVPRENPGYYVLGERAKALAVSWVDQGWYSGSEAKASGLDSGLGEEPVLVD